MKQEAEEKLQQVFEINKKKKNDLEGARDAELERLTEAHKAEVQRLKEEQRWGEEEMKKQHRWVYARLPGRGGDLPDPFLAIGCVAERVKASFLRRP